MNKTITESDPAGNIKRPFKPESSIVVDINSAPSLRKARDEPYDWSKETMPLDYEQTDLTPPHGIPRESIAPDNLRGKIRKFPLRVFEGLYVDKEPNKKPNLMTPNLKGFIMSSARVDEVRRATHDDRFNRHP
jgi:hypothetical protein